MSAELLREAAALMRERAQAATPGPWRDSEVGDNRYAALVADQPHPDRPNPSKGGWAWDDSYGGCLVGESLIAGDRAHIASWHPGVALDAADWLDDYASWLDVFEQGGKARTAENCPALRFALNYLRRDS